MAVFQKLERQIFKYHHKMNYTLFNIGLILFYIIPFISLIFLKQRFQSRCEKIAIVFFLFFVEYGVVYLFSYPYNYFNNVPSSDVEFFAAILGYNFVWLIPIFITIIVVCLIFSKR